MEKAAAALVFCSYWLRSSITSDGAYSYAAIGGIHMAIDKAAIQIAAAKNLIEELNAIIQLLDINGLYPTDQKEKLKERLLAYWALL